MLTFLRRQVTECTSHRRMSKYLLYTVGEIAMVVIGTPLNVNEESKLDSLLTQSMYYGNFNPSNSALDELIQSGKLKLISDDALKKNLFDWL